jgi:hypothetical protein
MSMNKRARLNRLVRVTRIIYRREAAELARKQMEVREAGEVVAEAERRLEAPLEGGDFLSQLAVTRAARARRHLAEVNTQVYLQLDAAKDAMSKKKGVESELEIHAIETQRQLATRDADEILERVAHPQKDSFR